MKNRPRPMPMPVLSDDFGDPRATRKSEKLLWVTPLPSPRRDRVRPQPKPADESND